ncbi:hypothetical protein M422DRAFT_26605 [Sphaerobolus stellatus SS14]|nr:hypothetical protein M422DRAFT_26605 [Sphaerobolus stellatus SS14]
MPQPLNSTEDAMGISIPPGSSLAFRSIPQLLLSMFFKNQEFVYLFLIGGLIESSRRYWSMVTRWFRNLFCFTAEFENNDEAYLWMMVWLSRQQGVWSKADSVYISTSNWGRDHHATVALPTFDETPEEESDGSRKLTLLPAFGSVVWFKYKGVWIAASRDKEKGDGGWIGRANETLSLRMYTRRKSSFLRMLIKDAKAAYGAEDEDKISIYTVDQYKEWNRTVTRKKRSLRSIILDPNLKKCVISDIKDFFGSEKWYADRGIPYRRGYLLYGVPGSGKTSLIHSIAGELSLDIYIVSLSKKGFDDRDIEDIFGKIPKRSIVLLEDIDAALRPSAKKRDGMDESDQIDKAKGVHPNPLDEKTSGGVTLSGLLNTLDGIAAQEGSIYFATTNRYHMLDKALCRPGRMDIHIEFNNATQWQAKELFKAFFPPTPLTGTEATDVILNYMKPQDGSEDMEKATLTAEEVERLSEEFSKAVPENRFAVANIQGHFLRHKDRPWAAVKNLTEWLAEETELKKAGSGPASDSAELEVVSSSNGQSQVNGKINGIASTKEEKVE